MRFEVEVLGEKLVARELLGRAERLEHPWPFFSAAANFLMRVEKAQFATDGFYASKGWAMLQPETIARKAFRGMPEPARPLHGWGKLERSLTTRGAPFQTLRMSDTELVFGTRVPYAVYHQSKAPRHVLPRRPVIEVTRLDKKHIERGMTMWVSRGLVWEGL